MRNKKRVRTGCGALFMLKDKIYNLALSDFFEYGFGSAADGAGPIVRELFEGGIPVVNVSADGADVFARFAVRVFFGQVSGRIFSRFAFHDFMVIGIRHGRFAAECFGADDFAEEDGMRGRIHRVDHSAGDVGAAVRDDRHGVPYLVGYFGEFVKVLSRTKAEHADDGRVCLFRQHADGEMTAVANALVCVVVFVDADDKGRGGSGDLCGAVCGAPRWSAVVPCAHDVNAVRDRLKRFRIHVMLLKKDLRRQSRRRERAQ